MTFALTSLAMACSLSASLALDRPLPVVEPQPGFSVWVKKPVFQGDTNRFNVWAGASFENVPTQLQVRLIARRTERADEAKSIVYPATETVQCPTSFMAAPVGQHAALTTHHRLVTALVRPIFRDDRPAGPLDAPLMRGVESVANLCHALDASHAVAKRIKDELQVESPVWVLHDGWDAWLRRK